MKYTESNTEFCIYLSYPFDRNDERSFRSGIKNSINIGTEIRAYLIDWEKMDTLPRAHLYIPAEHELFIHQAYTGGFITNTEILTVNCEIIKRCNLLILFGNYDTRFSNIVAEVGCAKKSKVAIYTMPNLSSIAIQALRFTIKTVLKSGG